VRARVCKRVRTTRVRPPEQRDANLREMEDVAAAAETLPLPPSTSSPLNRRQRLVVVEIKDDDKLLGKCQR